MPAADAPLRRVAVVDIEGGTLEITGDLMVDTFGALDDAKVVDPDAASATIPALLRGILEELQAQTALMTAANAKLDDIVTNTTP